MKYHQSVLEDYRCNELLFCDSRDPFRNHREIPAMPSDIPEPKLRGNTDVRMGEARSADSSIEARYRLFPNTPEPIGDQGEFLNRNFAQQM
jgi:hypothetical protein